MRYFLIVIFCFLVKPNAFAQKKALNYYQEGDLRWIESMFNKYTDTNYLNENKEAWQQKLTFIKETGIIIIRQRPNLGLPIINGNWLNVDTIFIKKIKQCIPNWDKQLMQIITAKHSIRSANSVNTKKPTRKSVSIIYIRIGLERNMVERMETKFLALKPYY